VSRVIAALLRLFQLGAGEINRADHSVGQQRSMIAQTALVFLWSAALNAGAINLAYDV
jgi:hypothetical protein